MAIDKREKIIENLAVASALGFLALIVAALSLVLDSRVSAQERVALVPEGTPTVLVGRADDPCFNRFYAVNDNSSLSFATVLTLRAPSGAALFGARFSPKGALQDLRFLGSCASRVPTDSRGLGTEFPEADSAISRAAAFARVLASDLAGAARESGS